MKYRQLLILVFYGFFIVGSSPTNAMISDCGELLAKTLGRISAIRKFVGGSDFQHAYLTQEQALRLAALEQRHGIDISQIFSELRKPRNPKHTDNDYLIALLEGSFQLQKSVPEVEGMIKLLSDAVGGMDLVGVDYSGHSRISKAQALRLIKIQSKFGIDAAQEFKKVRDPLDPNLTDHDFLIDVLELALSSRDLPNQH